MFTWWEVYREQCHRQLNILCFYHYGKLVGIAPFQIDKYYPQALVQGKTLRFIGQGDLRDDRIVSQYLDLIVLPGFEDDVVKSVSEYLLKHKNKWDFADFEYLLKDSLILKCFSSPQSKISCQKVEYGVRFSISGVDSFEAYKNSLGKRWRKMFVKKERLLNRDGIVTIESTDTLDSIDLAFKELSEMHCSRWKERVGHCVFESSHFNVFHRKLLKRLQPKNKAFIKTLLLNDEPLAAYYIFLDKGQVHYYQSGFHKQYANKYSPLFMLLCREIGVAIKKKQVFDFMYTDTEHSYKQSQYSAEAETMYRLRWATQPTRLPIFLCSKAIYASSLNIYNRVLKQLKKVLS